MFLKTYNVNPKSQVNYVLCIFLYITQTHVKITIDVYMVETYSKQSIFITNFIELTTEFHHIYYIYL